MTRSSDGRKTTTSRVTTVWITRVRSFCGRLLKRTTSRRTCEAWSTIETCSRCTRIGGWTDQNSLSTTAPCSKSWKTWSQCQSSLSWWTRHRLEAITLASSNWCQFLKRNSSRLKSASCQTAFSSRWEWINCSTKRSRLGISNTCTACWQASKARMQTRISNPYSATRQDFIKTMSEGKPSSKHFFLKMA